VTATGGSGGYSFTATGLPAGLSLSSGGVLSGTPTTSVGSPFSVVVTVKDSSNNTASANYQLTITDSGILTISGPATLPNGTIRTAYPATTVTATGGSGGYFFSATGLPTGMGISSHGVIIGTPQSNIGSPFTVQVWVTDSSLAVASKTYQLIINGL
jgi:large repetitive protein